MSNDVCTCDKCTGGSSEQIESFSKDKLYTIDYKVTVRVEANNLETAKSITAHELVTTKFVDDYNVLEYEVEEI